MNYENGDIYAVHPRTRLRNDGKYVIAAFPDEAAVPLIRMDPVTAVMITLFDGKRTCAEVADITSTMVHEDVEDPEKDTQIMLSNVIKAHTEPQGGATNPLLVPVSELSDEDRGQVPYFRTTDYIVKFEDYRPDDPQLKFPASLLWLLTNDCQTDCQYCYMDKPQVPQDRLLPFERVKEIVKEAHEGNVMGIYVSGGDVMCYPHIFDFCELMSDYNFHQTVLATKAYVSLDAARRLREYNYVKGIQFSIDSTVPEIADFMVQSPGFCERIMKSIVNVRRAGFEAIEAKCVITPYNIPTIPKMYRDLKAMGLSTVRFATYCKSGYHHKDKLYNHPDDFDWLDEQIKKLNNEFPDEEIFYQNGAPLPDPKTKDETKSTWENRSACTAGRASFCICANGRVVPCEQMPEREGDYIGDLRTQSLMDVWHSKELDEYLIHPPKDRFEGTACFDCDEYDKCQSAYGQCVRDCVIHYGTRWCPSPICPMAPEGYMRTM